MVANEGEEFGIWHALGLREVPPGRVQAHSSLALSSPLQGESIGWVLSILYIWCFLIWRVVSTHINGEMSGRRFLQSRAWAPGPWANLWPLAPPVDLGMGPWGPGPWDRAPRSGHWASPLTAT